MPELPEIETLRRELLALGKIRLTPVLFCRPGVRSIRHSAQLVKELPGRELLDVFRYGKYLELALSDGFSLWVHLGMSGQLFFQSKRPQSDKHVHFWIGIQAGGFLVYRDVRKFGRIELKPQNHPRKLPDFISCLGEDPLKISEDAFYAAMKKRHVAVKTLLLDQKVVAGVGNIYADEGLFLARLHPSKKGYQLKRPQAELLLESLRKVLQGSIQRGGTTFRDYRRTNGQKGENQFFLNVYGREKAPCPFCSRPIRRIVISARSSFFCGFCQR